MNDLPAKVTKYSAFKLLFGLVRGYKLLLLYLIQFYKSHIHKMIKEPIILIFQKIGNSSLGDTRTLNCTNTRSICRYITVKTEMAGRKRILSY